jgi:signal transduction histidine kinase
MSAPSLWSSLISRSRPLVGAEVSAEEAAAFAEHTRELTIKLWPGVGLLLAAAALLWWPLDRLVFAEPVAREAFANFRAVLSVVDVGFALALPRIAATRRHAHVAATVAALVNLVLSGWTLAEAGQGAPQWFSYGFMTPFLSVLLLVPLRTRVVVAASFAAAFIVSWLAHPHSHLATPGAGAGISYLCFCAALSVFIGHLVYVQVRHTFTLSRRVERQRLELASLAERLEERVLAQTEEIRELGARAQEVRAEQRLELARELHDSLGQELTSMRLLVDLGARLHADAPGSEAFDGLAAQLQRVQGSLRQVLVSLRPQPLEEGSLLESLAVLVGDFGRRSGVSCRFTHAGPVDALTSAQTLALYRIAQEGLTNAIRHARARRVELSLVVDGGDVTLELRDDGLGIDPARVGEGFGTRGIQERASALGGRATWAVDGGTRMRIALPLRRST